MCLLSKKEYSSVERSINFEEWLTLKMSLKALPKRLKLRTQHRAVSAPGQRLCD
jgi:hypothetical protein